MKRKTIKNKQSKQNKKTLTQKIINETEKAKSIIKTTKNITYKPITINDMLK